MDHTHYRLTEAGRKAWEDQDTAIPEVYRQLLWVIGFQGDARAIANILREHPEHLLTAWLGELQELRLIERLTEPPAHDPDRTIPLEEAELGKKAAGALFRTGAYLAAQRPAATSKCKSPEETIVMIVEDDPDQLALADLRVSMAGYRVRVASSIDGLLRSLLTDGIPDVLLLDVMLPDGDGFEVLAKMRRHRKFVSLPIVMLTIKSDPQDIGKGLTLGADGYVTKPYTKDVLVDVIRRVLGDENHRMGT